MSSEASQRAAAMRNTSIVGILVNAFLTVIKILFGIIGQSHSLVSDGIHSLADISTDVMVWVASRYTNMPADREHPYGHGRIETVFTVALALVLLVTAFGIVYDASQRIIDPSALLTPSSFVLIIAFISIVANEGLYQYTMRMAKRHKSGLLHANAWHHRSDAISSVVVLIGVAGSLIGFIYLDIIASIIVAIMIARIGWDQGKQAMLELIDTALEPKKVKAIRNIISEVEGVKDVHMLRTRRMGGNALVDVHVEVKPRISVSEGHQISEYVRMKLIRSITEVTDVTVHIDPEDDSIYKTDLTLPLRRDVVAALRKAWQGIIDDKYLSTMALHYLANQIYVDILLPLDDFQDATHAQQLNQRLLKATSHLQYIGDVKLYFGEPVSLTDTKTSTY
ncbi:MAG TPA: cation diffusion facilitator family transporter [Alcanivoracaceae bacterium]|nr:cation diffusion facilitator family transporter [Alcanivoracaceae bacterium]